MLVDGKWGYIDRDGKMAISPRFAEAEAFRDGRAVVRVGAGWGRNSGLIDATGKFIIDPQYEQISRIGDRFWSVGITDRAHRGNGEPPLLSRLVDAEGHFVSRKSYNAFGALEDGLISVCRKDRCGFMDIHGKLAIPLKYKGVDDFQEGLAAVTTHGNRYGFIDRRASLFSPNVTKPRSAPRTFWRGTIRERPGAGGLQGTLGLHRQGGRLGDPADLPVRAVVRKRLRTRPDQDRNRASAARRQRHRFQSS